MKPFTLILLFVAWAAGASAQPSADIEKEKAELFRSHKSDREAHFKTDVDALLQNPPEEFISVGSGKINRSSKDDVRKMFTGYFRDAKYYEWDDVEEPAPNEETRRRSMRGTSKVDAACCATN